VACRQCIHLQHERYIACVPRRTLHPPSRVHFSLDANSYKRRRISRLLFLLLPGTTGRLLSRSHPSCLDTRVKCFTFRGFSQGGNCVLGNIAKRGRFQHESNHHHVALVVSLGSMEMLGLRTSGLLARQYSRIVPNVGDELITKILQAANKMRSVQPGPAKRTEYSLVS
jgi:hypothetical protein